MPSDSAGNETTESGSVLSWNRKEPVSQIDVARLAGVSQAAISRTFTPGASVSDETRSKVMEAAAKLGYRPNVIARSLIRRSTNMIGLVVMRFTNPFYAGMIRDFTRALQDLGYLTLLFNIADVEEVEDALPAALQYQVDGLIITSATLSSRMAEECARSGTPVVLFNRYASSGNVNVVRCDDVLGGRLVADALLDAGHRRLAYIAGEEGASTNRDREQGFVQFFSVGGRNHLIGGEAGSRVSRKCPFQVSCRLIESRVCIFKIGGRG